MWNRDNTDCEALLRIYQGTKIDVFMSVYCTWKKFLGGKSQGLYGLERETATQSFSIGRPICVGRKFNFMSGVEIEGNRYETNDSMKSSINGFYKKLFSENESWRPKVEALSLPSLSTAAREALETSFDEEEGTRALHDCCGVKAPGPDGMTMAFLQANWDLVRGDVLSMFSEFYTNGKFVASLNACLLYTSPSPRDGLLSRMPSSA